MKEGDGVIALTEGASIGGLLEGSDGVLYTANNPLGSAGSECGPDCGDIIAIRKDGTATVLHTFWSTNFDGALPQRSLVEGDDGALYGTTKFGGAGGLGVVFKLNKEGGSYRVLYSFNATTDAAAPAAGLLKASDGVLYGTTYFGGDRGLGTVFKINQDGSGYAVVFSFSVGDGRNPQTTVVEGSDGYLYGTTRDGGGYGYGSVYSLNKDGSSYSLIHSFNVIDGQQPLADVIEGSDGHLYGTTHLGGTKTFAYGTIFKMRKDGGAFTVLANFGDSSDPQQPRARLVEASDGVLYGTAVSGGFYGGGAVFRLDKDGSKFSVLHSFAFSNGEGSGPVANLVEGSDGALYGTTQFGGYFDLTNAPVGDGTIFRLNKDGTGYQVLHQFMGQGDGAEPQGNLIEGSDKYFYGTATSGGGSKGTLYRIQKSGTNYTVLHVFGTMTEDGAFPTSGMVRASDGALYGTTQSGGRWGCGTVFRLLEDGSHYKVVLSFTPPNSTGGLVHSLIEASDGALYGTTSLGGAVQFGSVFRFLPPPEMSSIAVQQDGTALLRVESLSKNAVTIQRSTNLLLWTDLVTGITADGVFSFDSPIRGGEQYQFYRAKLGQ